MKRTLHPTPYGTAGHGHGKADSPLARDVVWRTPAGPGRTCEGGRSQARRRRSPAAVLGRLAAIRGRDRGDGHGSEVRHGRLPWRRAAIMAHLVEQQPPSPDGAKR